MVPVNYSVYGVVRIRTVYERNDVIEQGSQSYQKNRKNRMHYGIFALHCTYCGRSGNDIQHK